ncbi:MAG: hypothetical protein WBE26_03115 [Phycisphaerae bacterium]
MWDRQERDPAEVTVVIMLPLVAIDGDPQQLLLDVLGDASGCDLIVEAGDAQGWGFGYSFGSVNVSGWHTCSANVQKPSEFWGARQQGDVSGVVPPVQLFRLRLSMSESCEGVDIGFGALSVTGDVRLAPPGIAS